MKKDVKIALFTYLPLEHGGGLSTFYKTVADNLSKRYPNFVFTVISLSPRFADKITNIYSVYYFRKESQPVAPLKSKRNFNYTQAKSLSHLRKLLAAFDIVYSKNDIMDLLLLAAAGNSHIKKHIIGFHTPIRYHMTPTAQSKLHNVLYGSPLYKMLLAKADAFHVLNAYHEETLKRLFPDKPLFYIHNPIPFTVPKIIDDKTKRVSKQIRVIWIGRLTQDKGADNLIQLIQQLHKKRPGKYIWTVVGDGPMRPQIKKLSTEIPGIISTRTLPHKEVLKLYGKNDVMLMTSKWECFPYVVLEAQRAGLPVLSYNIPGCSDIIINTKTGRMAENFTQLTEFLLAFKPATGAKRILISKHTGRRFNTKSIYKQLYNLLTFPS